MTAATMPRRAARRPGAPLGYLFTPTPDALEDDPRAADAAVRAWGYVHRASKGTNALAMSWAELGTLCGRDRQWLKTWIHKLHNLGWATITKMSGAANLIVIHTSPEAHEEYRRLAGGEDTFFTFTDNATQAARAARETAPVIPSPRMETHPGVDEKSSPSRPAETGGSTTRAYARTREDHAHETTQCNAGEGGSVEQVENPVPLARGMRPASRPKKRTERPVPPRPQISPDLQALHQELGRAKLTVRWHELSPVESGMIAELLDALGAEQMARIAWKTTNAAVAAGKQPAHHVRAYINTWVQHAPVYGYERQAAGHSLPSMRPAPFLSPKCLKHPAFAMPCPHCITPASEHFDGGPAEEPMDPDEGRSLVTELRRKRAEAAAEGRTVGVPSRREARRLEDEAAARLRAEPVFDVTPLLFAEPTESEHLVDLGEDGWPL
ncbi:hypothetical protein EF910_32145 [Streptomyces sp. WAC07149]|uniref:hypothetical protein n=1 Tax=Streptomyces sp. WAC07149 TaxID=2487425 RepID=UPI000F76F93B|nr:hypothetical protein [Streptomyces sp. WAC07149]RST00388.1 hypothetical protein EF910_32145 [Streptomyces sp. WAC07149]